MQWTREWSLPPTSRSSSRIAPMVTEGDPDALLPDSLFEFVSNTPTNLLPQSAPRTLTCVMLCSSIWHAITLLGEVLTV